MDSLKVDNIRFTTAGNKYNSGFTLLETLVAIAILVSAVVVPLSLLSNNISASRQVQDQVTAVYLAQDAIEYIRYVTGTNSNDGTIEWLENLDSGGNVKCKESSKVCIIDSNYSDATNANAIQEFNSSASIPTLKYDATTGTYGYTGSTPTKFTRTISLTKVTPQPIPPGKISEVIVYTTVTWKSSTGANKSINMQHRLFNWRGKIE